MPRPRLDEALRHETTTEEEDEGFGSFETLRESAVVAVPVKRGKGKRSVEDMLASQPNSILQSAYALQRIAGLEDQIANILSLCSQEARELVIKQRPTLKRYAPEE
jgi:hypothetical protein